jgi:hypothetical protein
MSKGRRFGDLRYGRLGSLRYGAGVACNAGFQTCCIADFQSADAKMVGPLGYSNDCGWKPAEQQTGSLRYQVRRTGLDTALTLLRLSDLTIDVGSCSDIFRSMHAPEKWWSRALNLAPG